MQKLFFALLRLTATSLFAVAGLDRRFGWSDAPLAIVAVGCVVFGLGTLAGENGRMSPIDKTAAGRPKRSRSPADGTVNCWILEIEAHRKLSYTWSSATAGWTPS